VGQTLVEYRDYVTVAYEAATGERRWIRHYDGPGHGQDHADSVAIAGSRVFVTGWSYGGGSTGYDYATIAYDASSGANRFLLRYDNGGGSDNAHALAVSPDGSKVAVTGKRSTGNSDFATVAYAA
jgi:hypothetical protein